jgi:hypothetical protein
MNLELEWALLGGYNTTIREETIISEDTLTYTVQYSKETIITPNYTQRI